MLPKYLRQVIPGVLLCAATVFPQISFADGIVLGGTRIVYPVDTKQTTLSVRNASSDTSYLVQSWTEDARGDKSTDFLVTPPLYVSNPGDQNILRVMYSGKAPSQDRETLYYFSAKAIPSIDKTKIEGKNTLLFAAVTRIKVFLRPKGLSVPVEKAPSMLTFTYSGNKVEIKNPTPYHITLVQITVDGKKQMDTMVAPFSSELLSVSGKPRVMTYSTINDYGAISDTQKKNF
ncbi:fimbrial chaperone protein [Salmonella enterica subsp. enterica]|nr:fimbrial chaperone protein [Salmonella enterica subsp. enterica serovar Bonn]EBZ5939333.1 fimbrial chaperone protein [Salmonella enterica subsp. enterica serovar Muenchen]MLZ41076.1 fimbrial chaperone protein [Salmonella enterica subsp. enterica serovar Bonn]